LILLSSFAAGKGKEEGGFRPSPINRKRERPRIPFRRKRGGKSDEKKESIFIPQEKEGKGGESDHFRIWRGERKERLKKQGKDLSFSSRGGKGKKGPVTNV